jgi:RNA polymerase subunit RPABC4/transcription elongation factor Spt4
MATGMTTLGEAGLKRIEQGITTIEEVLKAVQQKEELTTLCPSCARAVSLDFRDCPFCREPLVRACQSCGRVAQPDWIVCPYCKEDLQTDR